MTKETLRQLIEVEYERVETISQFKSEVFRLIDLYESDRSESKPLSGYKGPILTNPCNMALPDEVPYSEICACNPKNGGNGLCGCVLPNKMVPNPKKYGSTITTTSTGTDIKIN